MNKVTYAYYLHMSLSRDTFVLGWIDLASESKICYMIFMHAAMFQLLILHAHYLSYHAFMLLNEIVCCE